MGTTLNKVGTMTTAPGSGFHCEACRQPITSSQVECRCASGRFHQWCLYVKSIDNVSGKDGDADDASDADVEGPNALSILT